MKLLIYDDSDHGTHQEAPYNKRNLLKQAFHLKLKISKFKSASRYANFMLRTALLFDQESS